MRWKGPSLTGGEQEVVNDDGRLEATEPPFLFNVGYNLGLLSCYVR